MMNADKLAADRMVCNATKRKYREPSRLLLTCFTFDSVTKLVAAAIKMLLQYQP